MPLNDVLFKDTNPAPVKVALGMMGKATAKLRMPLGLPTKELQEEVRETLIDLNILSREEAIK